MSRQAKAGRLTPVQVYLSESAISKLDEHADRRNSSLGKQLENRGTIIRRIIEPIIKDWPEKENKSAV